MTGPNTVVVTEMRGVAERWKLRRMRISVHLGIRRLVVRLGLVGPFVLLAATVRATGPIRGRCSRSRRARVRASVRREGSWPRASRVRGEGTPGRAAGQR